MTITQLNALIGCILKYKLTEIIITDVTESTVYYTEQNKSMYCCVTDFINLYLKLCKIYIDDSDESLVPINVYLEHFDIK